ncbi:MAG: hypothetical protein KGH58_00935 [Candidatus Micrarchaeota archaeon]|nr:hypothetical protein [Candidatus Micrarchaeota archaeon]
MAKQKLVGFRVMVLPDDSVLAERKAIEMLRGYGARYLRKRSDGDITGRIEKLDADQVFEDVKKMMKDGGGRILDLTVQPLYSG